MATTKITTDNIDLSGNTRALEIPTGTTGQRPGVSNLDFLVVAAGGGVFGYDSPGGGGGMVPSSFSSLIFIPPNGVGYSLDVIGSGITIIARHIARSIGPLRCRRVDEPQSNASHCECKR